MTTQGSESKYKHTPIKDTSVQYLFLPSESKDVSSAGRGTYGFRNRYLAKRRMLRTLHRLRREHA